MTRPFVALFLVPTLAAATPYDGRYKQTTDSDCGVIGQEGGAIEIEDGIFKGVELQCRMTRPVSVVDMDATLYVQCSGQAELDGTCPCYASCKRDDVIMLWDGYAFVYEACAQPRPDI